MKMYLCAKCETLHRVGEPSFEEHQEFNAANTEQPSFFGQQLTAETPEMRDAPRPKASPVIQEIQRIKTLAERSGVSFSEVVMVLMYVESKRTGEAWAEIKDLMELIQLRHAPELR